MLKALFNTIRGKPVDRIVPSITPDSREGLHGCVEDIGPTGIRGWLLDAAACDARLKVDAYLDGHFIGSSHATGHRLDLSAMLGRPIACEFLIPWNAAALPSRLWDLDPNRELRVRIIAADSGRELHTIDELAPTAGDIMEYVESEASVSQPVEPREQHPEQKPEARAAAGGQDAQTDEDVKAIAFFLPHFHPIPENDAWWGAGFTEWTNVTRASPQFPGHHQPQLPGELGFYDLRLEEVREQQARLAREHGIHGFCYHHYWFNGRRILEKPLQMVLDSGRPDFPFCICWANENWTRSGDAWDTDILLEQKYGDASDSAFIKDVMPILKDPRYIRVRGAPLLLVHRVDLLPNPLRTAAVWREACKEAGLGAIHLCAVETPGVSDPYAVGFDSSAQCPPHRVQTRHADGMVQAVTTQFNGRLHDYQWTVADEISAPRARYRRFRGVMTGWDNFARRGSSADIFVNGGPQAYEVWLRGIVDATRRDLPPGERFVFINAWNEWALGAHLEPDQKFGRAYLEATCRALTGTSTWRTLVDYASRRGELSGAVLTDWLRDVGAVLEREELSGQHPARSPVGG